MTGSTERCLRHEMMGTEASWSRQQNERKSGHVCKSSSSLKKFRHRDARLFILCIGEAYRRVSLSRCRSACFACTTRQKDLFYTASLSSTCAEPGIVEMLFHRENILDASLSRLKVLCRKCNELRTHALHSIEKRAMLRMSKRKAAAKKQAI